MGTPPATSERSSRSSSLSSDASSPLPLAALASRMRTSASRVRAPSFASSLPLSFCARNASHRVARSASSSTYIGALRLYASTCSGLTCADGSGRGVRVRRGRGGQTRSGCPVEISTNVTGGATGAVGRERAGGRRLEGTHHEAVSIARHGLLIRSLLRAGRAAVEGLHPPAFASRARAPAVVRWLQRALREESPLPRAWKMREFLNKRLPIRLWRPVRTRFGNERIYRSRANRYLDRRYYYFYRERTRFLGKSRDGPRKRSCP